ncbi:MAG: helix-turn-helix transcriptional regulator [Lachnospiraceae bacterium]|nr:helix-turn-helix transcriptional regulator [Lachnospiraceae bacterium]
MRKELDVNVVGKRIREIRESRQLTREQLAEQADISVQFLADIEVGRKSMSINTLFKLSSALHVSNDYLILGITNTQICNSKNLSILLDSLSVKELEIAEKIISLYIQGLSLKEQDND